MATTVLDPYATLGIPVGATRAEAARAHRRLAKRFHPDVNPGPEAAERMRRINQAWRTLASGAPRPAPTSPVTWTTWPEDRVASAPRARRQAPEPVPPSFGDRPVVLVAVWLVLGLMYVIGAWLGSISP
jgi:DnaJ domain